MGIRFAIVGANSQIAKNTAYYLSKNKNYDLFLFSRDPQKTKEIMTNFNVNALCFDYNCFFEHSYDVILNCVGINSFINETCASVFETSEEFDQMCLTYLKNNPDTKYIFLSSGAVYGEQLPANNHPTLNMGISKMSIGEYYAYSKASAEIKHRALNMYNIIDLRVFSYFSRIIPLNYKYLLVDIINAILKNEVMVTNSIDIYRDYISPIDFVEIIAKVVAHDKPLNKAFDIYSRSPVSKFELLNSFKDRYGLKYSVETANPISATGVKKEYFSTSRELEMIGYSPSMTSLETLIQESDALLKKINKDGNLER